MVVRVLEIWVLDVVVEINLIVAEAEVVVVEANKQIFLLSLMPGDAPVATPTLPGETIATNATLLNLALVPKL